MSRRDRNTREAIVRAAGAVGPVIRAVDAPVQPSVFGYFDRAYVINRNCDTGRLAKTSARLQRLGVPFERFAAVEFRADERLFPDKPQLTLSNVQGDHIFLHSTSANWHSDNQRKGDPTFQWYLVLTKAQGGQADPRGGLFQVDSLSKVDSSKPYLYEVVVPGQ